MKTQILMALALVWTLAACTDASAWRNDPAVVAARDACKSGSGVDYNCIEGQAVTALNPEICRLAGIGIDDMCLQAVYVAANDPSICDRIYLRGVVPNCRAYYAPPSPSQDLSAFYGNRPPAAILIVGEQAQVAAVGTSTWTLEKKGQEQTTVHGDAFALVTPVQSLVVPESFSAILRLPIPAVPSTLWYALKPVNDTIVRSSDQGTTRWQVSFLQPGTSLDLKSEQEISFSLDPGQYLLEVFAEWPVLGSADYGFFLEVQSKTAISTFTTSPEPWKIYKNEKINFSVQYPHDWYILEIPTGGAVEGVELSTYPLGEANNSKGAATQDFFKMNIVALVDEPIIQG